MDPTSMPHHESRHRARARWPFAALLTVLAAAGCGEGPASPGGAFEALAGTWHATLFRWTRVADPGAGSVDLIALGGAMILEVESNGQVLLTTREVGARASESVLGGGRIVGRDRLELDTGGATPVALDYALTGDILRLTGRLTLRPAGIGQEEEVDLEAVLIRRAAALH